MSVPVGIHTVTKSFGPRPARSASSSDGSPMSGSPALPVLDGVSLTAPAGQITTILGESGCGKTTLLRIVAGLEMATAGRIVIGDRDVTAVPAAKRQVAMVFQNYGLYPAKTVAGNIEFPLKMAGVPRAERRARALGIARVLHIDHVIDRLPAQLSGGQRQRVGIGRALAREPAILLMDEPLSNLDAQLRVEMRSEIVGLQRRFGSTMLYVTHDQTEAMTMSDLIVVMRGGRIEQLGAPLEVFREPRTAYVAAFLGGMNLAQDTVSSGIVPLRGAPEVSGVTVGVRPEHFFLEGTFDARPDDLVIEGHVRIAELLGTDRVLHIAAGSGGEGLVWRARIDAASPFGESVRVRARRENIHTFDTATGTRRAA